jgi:hypothetical protein
MSFSLERISDYIALAVALHGVALLICNLTPSPNDNEALGNISVLAVKLYRAMEIIAGIITPLAKR